VARRDSGAGKAARGVHALEGRRREAERGSACGGFRGRDLRGWVALLEAHLTLTSPEYTRRRRRRTARRTAADSCGRRRTMTVTVTNSEDEPDSCSGS